MTTLAFPDTTGKPTDGSFTYEANGVIYSWTGDYWAANNAQGFDHRYVNVDGDQMTGDLTVPSLNGGPLAGFRNAIINGGLEVGQRDAGGFAGGVYTTDRWHVSAGTRTGRQTRSLGRFNSVMLCLAGSGILLLQPIETPAVGHRGPFQPNTEWTCSFWTTATGADLTGIGVGLFHGEGSTNTNLQDITGQSLAAVTVIPGQNLTDNTGAVYQRVSVTFTLNANVAATGNAIQFRVNFGSLAADVRSTGFQLEPGSQPTPFEMRPVSTELALCQRYFYKLTTSGSVAIMSGLCRGPVEARFTYSLPTTMRSSPTFSYVGATNLYAVSFRNTANVCSRLDMSTSADARTVAINADASGMTAGEAALLVANGAGGLNFDAEL